MTLTYVYCLTRSARALAIPKTLAGMPGSRDVRVLDAGRGLKVVVSTVDAGEYDEAALAAGLQNLDWVSRRAMAHETVVEHFLSAPAVLPMQLFSLFSADERVLAHVAKQRARIDRILARIERRHEWGLRLTFDEKAVASSPSARPASRRAAVSGADYLLRKRDLLDVSRVQLGKARKEADRLYRVMAKAADAARRRDATVQATPGSRLLLDAAFLVPVRRANGFRAVLRKQAGSFESVGLVASLTGPWPPYNFIDGRARST